MDNVLGTLTSNQEEADTCVVIYEDYAARSGFSSVVTRSPDSDMFFIMLHFALHVSTIDVYFDTGSAKNRQIFNMLESPKYFGQR